VATLGILGNHDFGPGWAHPELAERIEREICAALPGASVTAHLEPIEDEASYTDIALAFDRWESGGSAEPAR
jgi:hypothetical protein